MTWIAEQKVIWVFPSGERRPGRIAVGMPEFESGDNSTLMSGTSAPVSPDAEEPVPSFFLVFRRETLDRVAFLSWIGDMCPRERAEWRSRGLR